MDFTPMPIAPGTSFGPYEIIAMLGAGGMGEVYKARDTRLNRIVAIKFLKAGHAERFQREARAIASLNHPHICALYDVGPDYLVMEFVEGAPLKGPMPDAEALGLSIQIAGALDAAHRKGIAHRDLKPANILVTSSGAKLLDFGLAKAISRVEPGEETLSALTEAGMIVGTAAYMSPEQAEGKPVDERSDIFSFGTVLYEMLSGRRAFHRDTQIATLAAVLRDPPQPLPTTVQVIFRDVLDRCLQKDPSLRFESAANLSEALRQIDLKKPAGETPSIAILPFANLSADRDNEYFSDGLAEEIINALSQIPGLHVAARTSAFALRGKDLSIRRIGEELNVATVLEGSLRRAGNRMRLTVQLVNVADGFHLWSERYDREMTDVFAIQDEISQAIVDKLKVQLGRSGAPPVGKRHTDNLEAYHCYLQGRYHLHRYSPENLPKALDRFRRALELDPDYALAYAGIADYYYISTLVAGASPVESLPAARLAAKKAVELDDSLPDAHGILSAIEAMHYNWPEATASSRRALELDPANVMARYYYAAWLLRPQGRFEEAAIEMERLVEQDPLSPRFGFVLALTLYNLRRYDEAIRQARRVIDFDQSNMIAHWVLACSLLAMDRLEEALAAAESAVVYGPKASMAHGALACVQARMGRRDEAIAIMDRMRQSTDRTYWGHTMLACIYNLLGEPDEAIVEYMAAIEIRESNTIQLIWDPLLYPLRQHPRFPELLAAMNLPAR
ncbi:MAG: protein kinase [Acidobacteriia bacterium]|nr:protein kinase [Terriglobia bacterium]